MEDVQYDLTVLPQQINVGIRQSMHFAFSSSSFSTEKTPTQHLSAIISNIM